MRQRTAVIRITQYLASLLICFAGSLRAETTEQFLDRLETSIKNSQSQEFVEMVNFNALINKVFSQIKEMPKARRDDFRKGFLDNRQRAGVALLNNIGGAPAKRLRLQKQGKLSKALYRIDLGEQGYNYIEWWIQPSASNQKLQIVDFYSYALGKSWSGMVKELIIFSQLDSSNLRKMFSRITGEQKDINRITNAISNYTKTRNPQPFIAAYNQASEKIRSDSSIIAFYVSLASQSQDEAIYKDALSAVARYKQKDPKSSFMLVDHYFYLGQYNKAYQALNRFESILKLQDAAIINLKSNALFMAKDYDRALSLSRKARDMEPKLEDSYWSEVNVLLEQKRHAELVQIFKQLELNFGYRFERANFIAEPVYRIFVRSDEFSAWLNTDQPITN